MSYEYEFEDEEMNVLGVDVTVSGIAEFCIGNDSFDYDYGSISSTHKCPDYVEDLRVTKLCSVLLHDEETDISHLITNHDKVLESIAAKLDHYKILQSLAQEEV
jgi:hypothetical protein